MFTFSERSKKNLEGVHPDLVRVAELALQYTDVDFVVTDGLRTAGEQAKLFAAGKSRTKNSRHLTGHAVDIAAWAKGQICWDLAYYETIADAFKTAASELNVPIEWGGDWKTFRDGPHFQLPRTEYPA